MDFIKDDLVGMIDSPESHCKGEYGQSDSGNVRGEVFTVDCAPVDLRYGRTSLPISFVFGPRDMPFHLRARFVEWREVVPGIQLDLSVSYEPKTCCERERGSGCGYKGLDLYEVRYRNEGREVVCSTWRERRREPTVERLNWKIIT